MDQPILLKINTPKGPCGSVEVTPNETTVQDLHNKVKELLNYTETDYFVMVLAGKKLTDMDTKLSDYKVRNNGVVIVAKMSNPPPQTKPAASTASATSTASTTSTSTTTSTPAPSPVPPSTSSSPAPQSSSHTVSPSPSPAPVVSTPRPVVTAPPTAVPATGAVAASAISQSDIQTLRTANIGQLLDRDIFISFVQNLHEKNPELAEELMSNPELLLETVAQVSTGFNLASLTGGAAGQRHRQQLQRPQTPNLEGQLDEAGKDAVSRLEALGFTRHQATQAYIICDKNEEIAANYLFDSMSDF